MTRKAAFVRQDANLRSSVTSSTRESATVPTLMAMVSATSLVTLAAKYHVAIPPRGAVHQHVCTAVAIWRA